MVTSSEEIQDLYERCILTYVVTSLPDVGAGVSDQHEGDDRSNVPMDGTRRSRYGRVLKPKKPTDYNDL